MQSKHLKPLHDKTLAVSAGLVPDPFTHAISPNISMSVNNCFVPGEGSFSANGINDLADAPFLYAGWTNPTVRQLEMRLAALEAADDAYAASTGMAAMSALFFSLLKSGDHLIISDVCYAGINELALNVLPTFGIEVTAVNLSQPDELEAAIRPNTKLVHAETPCNPLLRLTDLKTLGEKLKSKQILLSVDSTFATPVITKPIELGADLVVHSLTKFINGHGDVLGGCVIGNKALISSIRAKAGVYLGASLSAHSAWLIMRGIDTLYPRMAMMSESARLIASWLEKHPRVISVIYPGLASHPQAKLAQQQMAMGGAVIVFQVSDLETIERRFAHESRLFYYAFSIGHQRSLAVLMKTDSLMATTYQLSTAQQQDYHRFAGQGVFRLSIGLESAQDIIDDLAHILR
jgi:cystathionine beta-lyase/cystathionine gamma-synthase